MAEKKYLSREDILGAKDIETIELHVPEWGGVIMLRSLTGKQKDNFEGSVLVRGKKPGEVSVNPRRLRVKLIIAHIVDKDGKPVFNDSNEDIELIAGKGSYAIDRIFKKCQEISGMGDDQIEALEEGLEDAQGGDSPSD